MSVQQFGDIQLQNLRQQGGMTESESSENVNDEFAFYSEIVDSVRLPNTQNSADVNQ